jgi:hypothetical protein
MSMVSEAIAENHAEEVEALQQEIKRLRKALEFVLAWQFPATGKFWDDEKTRPMTYGAAYGSNGERDYMKQYIREALNAA